MNTTDAAAVDYTTNFENSKTINYTIMTSHHVIKGSKHFL